MSLNNNLHQYVASNPADVPPDRITGRTTGLALKFLSDAILNPGTCVVIEDHRGTASGNRHLHQTIIYFARRLRLTAISKGNDNGKRWIQFDLLKKDC